MEIVIFEDLMRKKLAECEDWLNGGEVAKERVAKAEAELVEAQNALSQYNDQYIEEVKAYMSDLKARLGICDEKVCDEPICEEVEQIQPVQTEVII